MGCGTWALEHPLPTANNLTAAWAASACDAWAIGDGPTLLHWDGASWTPTEPPTTDTLLAIWGSGPTDVWLAAAGSGGSELFRFDGTAWRSHSLPPSTLPVGWAFDTILGTGPNDVWFAAGYFFARWDGSAWIVPSSLPDPITAAIWGHPLWPAGNGTAWTGWCPNGSASFYFWDGLRWTRMNTGGPGCVTSIAGVSPDDIWATVTSLDPCPPPEKGYCWSHQLLHWDGAGWSANPSPVVGPFSPAPGEVWVANGGGDLLARAVSGAFEPFAPWVDGMKGNLSFAGTGPDNVLMIGRGGALARFDGKTTQSLNLTSFGLADLWGSPSGDAWAVGEAILRRHNGQWSRLDLGDAGYSPEFQGPAQWSAVSGSADDNVWVAGGDVVVHWDGQGFTQRQPPTRVSGMWVSPAGHAYFTSDALYRAGPSGFTKVLDAPCYAVWGTSDTDIWLLLYSTAGAQLAHFDGTAATLFATMGPADFSFDSIRGSSADDVWASTQEKVLHYDGRAWTDLSPPDGGLSSFDVRGPGDVWGIQPGQKWYPWVFDHETLLHFDGRAWSSVRGPASGQGEHLRFAGGDFYTVGSQGRICRKPR